MLCPTCKTVNLVMSERQGIEIDYCPQCRGVWLDRGELDRIIERTVPQMVNDRDDDRNDYREQREFRAPQRYSKEQHTKRKRKSWLEDIFDF